MQLTEAECRIAWHRDMLNPAIEKTKRQYLNRKTGEYEEQDALYVDIRTVATKEQIAAEKRLSSVQVVRNNASQKAIENSKAAAINFLSMSADDEFFAVAWPGFLIFDQWLIWLWFLCGVVALFTPAASWIITNTGH